jgi:hypothetical protein
VHDAAAVRLVQRVRDFDSDAQRFLRRERLARQAGGQGLALQVLHHQKGDTILAANVIEHTDVGVLQAGDGLGLALKTSTELRVLT